MNQQVFSNSDSQVAKGKEATLDIKIVAPSVSNP